MKSLLTLTLLAVLGTFCVSSAMPLSPESQTQLAASGKLAAIGAHEMAALQKGIDAPGANILASFPQSRRDDADEVTLHVPVILTYFSDNRNDSIVHTRSHYDQLLFSEGQLNPGSMHEWYLENTYGEVHIVGDVVGWYRMPMPYSFYVDGQWAEGDYPRNSQGLTVDAVRAADASVDFRNYDNNGDGVVDALFIVHAGSGAEANNGDSTMIWSHAWALNDNAIQLDSVEINGYTVVPEDGQVGVFGHELGHALFGLPDLYDRDYTSTGLGVWSMMAAGSWGGGGASPSHFDAWCKMQIGVIQPEVLAEDRDSVSIPPIMNENAAYLLWTRGQPHQEYYLIENRQRIGFDASLPQAGLAIYHIDESVGGGQNDNEWYPGHENQGHYLVAVEQADGNWDLERNNNRGDGGDPYPGSTGNSSFEANSSPSSRSYAGGTTDVTVSNIRLDRQNVICDLKVQGNSPNPNWISYDDGSPNWLNTASNYWSKVTFTAPEDFTLARISVMAYNPGPNNNAPCFVRVYREGMNHDLGDQLYQYRIAQVAPFAWRQIEIPAADRPAFRTNENFTIMYGPAPGGNYNGNPGQGEGWWNLYDNSSDVNRSFIIEGNNPAAGHDQWSALGGDLFIRAGFDEGPPLNPSLQVRLAQGWNMMSINVIPPAEFWQRREGPDVIAMTEQFRENENHHRLVILKDDVGRFYLPEFGFSNLFYWSLVDGYQVNVDTEVVGEWGGFNIPPTSDIPLNVGWNTIPYYPTYPLNAASPTYVVVTSIRDHLIIAKDGLGRFMLPEFDFSNMDTWVQGQGYQVKVDAACVLNYPGERRNVGRPEIEPKTGPAHWQPPRSTGENMSLLVNLESVALNSGSGSVAAFSTDGRCVGSSSFQNPTSNNPNQIGLAIWGDDPFTPEKEGLATGEAFELKLWDGVSEYETNLMVSLLKGDDGLVYSRDKIIVVSARTSRATPESFYLTNCYPDPFNSTTRFEVGVPATSEISVILYDVQGRVVKVLAEGSRPAGRYGLVLNSDGMSNGIYFLRLETKNFKGVRKIALVQ